jgi:UDP-N-acetylglucosamine transferase subunit ALG13
MIFVTTGTNEQGFDRLTRAARALGGAEELVVQYGSSRIQDGPGTWEAFLPFADMRAAMERARVVVAHAGVGSILLAHRCGRRPVVMPRRVGLGEAVDDHQLGLARRLEGQGLVTVVQDAGELARAVTHAPTSIVAVQGGVTGGLVAELRATLERLTAPVPVATR